MTEIDDTTQKHVDISNSNNLSPPMSESKLPCTIGQLLAISLPIMVAGLFAAIFVPIYVKHKDDNTKFYVVYANNTEDSGNNNGTNGNNGTSTEEVEFDEFEENITNVTYATLTPKGGYDNILIFLGGIGNVANQYFDLFKGNNTFVPKRTKIYSISGYPRIMQFVIDYYGSAYETQPVPGWFNIDSQGKLCPTEHDFTEAKESLNIMLGEIDRIKSDENVDYRKIYLSGFSQGGMMTTYILLNSAHELGGYVVFSGYVFDHDFLENQIIYDLSDAQTKKLKDRENYHIIATHSFKDDGVFYPMAHPSYQYYCANYTDFKLISFGLLPHVLPEQPIHPIVKNWLKERMGK